MATMMKNIFVVVAVVCSMYGSVGAQWRTVEIPDTLSRYTTVKGVVSAPDGSVIVLSDHEYNWWTYGGHKHTRWFARIHRVFQDGTVRHLGTISNGDNEYEPGTRFSDLTVLNDTLVIELADQSDFMAPTRIGVLDMTSDSIFVSEGYPRVHFVCDSRRMLVGMWSGEVSTFVDIKTGEELGTQLLDGEITGLGPIIARRVTDDSVFVERTCTSESVGLRVRHDWQRPLIEVGQTGYVYLYERDTAASQYIVGLSWSNDMGYTFSNVSRPGTIIAYGSMTDGDHAFVSQHPSGSKFRVSFADRYGNLRFGYYEASDTLRIEAVAGRDRKSVALGVNWYDSTYKAHVGVAFLDPNVSVEEEVRTTSPLTWAVFTTIGQYVSSGEGAFEAAILDRGMYIVVEGGKARLVMRQ
ncbi:MAG: hypothetical protein NTX15_09285 [Candidatus Kapabacteria bacterium]|nr:hypothetical protein [Candidatus Kapabacteria bacterium]